MQCFSFFHIFLIIQLNSLANDFHLESHEFKFQPGGIIKRDVIVVSFFSLFQQPEFLVCCISEFDEVW